MANTTKSSIVEDYSGDPSCFILDDPDDVIQSHKVSMFSSMFFVVVGIIGNGLSIAVFTNKAMRSVSSNTYLLVLAVSDNLYLVSVFFANILKTLRCMYFINYPLDITNRNSILCQVFQYSSDFFSDYSTVLILVFTIERVVAVYLPMRFKELCTVLRARVSCLIMFVVISIFIAPYHFLFMGKYMDENGTAYDYCTVLPGKERTFIIMYSTESLVCRVLPVITIAVLNVFIIVKVRRLAAHRNSHRAQDALLNRRTDRDEKNIQLTIMLILVSTSYVLVYLPVLVHFVLEYLHRHDIIDISEHDMLIAGNYTSALYVSGFAINFFLYTVSGRVFRGQLVVILKSNKQWMVNKCRLYRNIGEAENINLTNVTAL